MIRILALSVLIACAPLGCTTKDNAAPSATTAQRLNPEAVPADLRHLVPLAQRWGIGDDVERNAKVESSTPAEREELRTAITPVHASITAWLDSFGQGAMSNEAAAFMYMQLALEELPADGSR
jgi:hypothetical protein